MSVMVPNSRIDIRRLLIYQGLLPKQDPRLCQGSTLVLFSATGEAHSHAFSQSAPAETFAVGALFDCAPPRLKWHQGDFCLSRTFSSRSGNVTFPTWNYPCHPQPRVHSSPTTDTTIPNHSNRRHHRFQPYRNSTLSPSINTEIMCPIPRRLLGQCG